MAPVGQTFSHAPHLPLVRRMQCAALMVARLGMAWGKGMPMAVVKLTFSLKASGTLRLGHFSSHAPQPVHLVQST